MKDIRQLMEAVHTIFYKSNGRLNLFGMIVAGIVLFIIAHLIVGSVSRFVANYVEHHEIKNPKNMNQRRVKTITNILGNLAKYGVYLIALMIFFDLCRINTSTILATAGIGSIAIAMGAQVMIRDLITGFFIIFDDQYRVGEYVELAGESGYVEALNIRTTVLKDFDGSRHIIPNSEIRMVTNRARGAKRAKVVVPVNKNEDPDRVIAAFKEAVKKIKEIYPDSRTEIWGTTDFIPGGYEITAIAWGEPSLKFDMEYDLRKCLIQAMNEHNIQMPSVRYENAQKEVANG